MFNFIAPVSSVLRIERGANKGRQPYLLRARRRACEQRPHVRLTAEQSRMTESASSKFPRLKFKVIGNGTFSITSLDTSVILVANYCSKVIIFCYLFPKSAILDLSLPSRRIKFA